MKRILISSLLFITVLGTAVAQDVTFVASAPKAVEVNSRFQLSYELNTKADGQPTLPEVDGLNILTGPHLSTFTSSQNINGHRTSKQSFTYTYTVVASVEGNMEIPAASVIVGGKKLTSNPLTVKVLPQDQASSLQGGGNGSSGRQQGSSTNISKEDLFVLATVNKTKVYDQEALLLSYKVYFDVNLRNLSNPTPELKGFNIQEIDLPEQPSIELEHYNGRNYNTILWRQYVLFPQETGKIEIPAMEYEALVAVQTRRSMDPFEMMFNGGYSYMDVRKTLKSNKVVVNVEKLPAGKPEGFSGGVGRFSISSIVSTEKLKSNEEFTLKVTVKGNGNMRFMGDPVINFPSEFDVYDPIVTNSYKLTAKGFTGEKIYEYVVTPRTAGTFTVPAAKFSYFDTASGKYKTIEGKEHTIEVEKGAAQAAPAGNIYVVKQDGKILANDIRYIKLGGKGEHSGGNFYASSAYYLIYIIAFSTFLLLILVYRKRVKENSNIMLVKTKKANSVAVRRLKKVKTLMLANQVNEFYDEILKAIWGYMSDKLNIPLSQLSKDNISNELTRRGCNETLVAELMELLNEGEFARYAPGDANATMDKVYRMALAVIGKMENSIKK